MNYVLSGDVGPHPDQNLLSEAERRECSRSSTQYGYDSCIERTIRNKALDQRNALIMGAIGVAFLWWATR